MSNNYRYQEPITKISAVNLGKPVTLELAQGKCVCQVIIDLTVTASSTGIASKTIPTPAMGLGEIRFNGNNTNRKRTAAQLFGARGLNAKNAPENAGTVMYYQAGAAGTSPTLGGLPNVVAALNGFTFGNEPVLIGSAEDIALQGALVNTTATTAVFSLPLIFAEDFRKTIAIGEAMALVTGYDDGSSIKCIIEADVPAATGVAGTMTAVAVNGSLIYYEAVMKKGATPLLSKEKIHQKNYDVGQIEIGDVFANKDKLQRFSVLTLADKMTAIQIKQGSRTVRNVTFSQNESANRTAQFNGKSVLANRFDVEMEMNDDPQQSLQMGDASGQELSVLVTFATANDNPKVALILASYYGPME